MAHWIDRPDALRARLSSPPSRVGLDTEFVRERTYWPKLALVQIALPTDDGGIDILLVDPLVPGMNEALAPLLANEAVLKIMHSPSEDLIALRETCGEVPRPLFDTQAAAALAGVGAGLGYQKLVAEITGVALEKGETRSDWMRRPLSASQLKYAAEDVAHLFEIHDALVEKLDTLGRLDWLDADMARTVALAIEDPVDRWPHLSMRSAQFFDRDAQARLLRLLRWRDAHARTADLPRSWVLDNELAATLARSVPTDRDVIAEAIRAHPKGPRKLVDAIWNALVTPLSDEAEAPDAAQAERRDKNRIKAMQDAVSERATELGVADAVLASRRMLEPLLDTGEWPESLAGWRREQLEPALTPLLTKR
ncbi:ribonuclease D [Cognatilysobacter terrigena]|uniref:ribonuclease D n=1 Tax=Cognatilysobacter terrigena TaxID=2488749 RepID=UPI00105EC8BD|nr:ribonuclease D [Lysobacter terrigena]